MRKIEWMDFKGVDGKLTREWKEGVFHAFGVNYEEFETGPGNYSTAIIELPDGTIKNIPVENIKFVESDKDNLQERLREIIQGPI